MQFDRDINKYLILHSASIADALSALNSNKLQILFVTNSDRKLLGSFTDGDFRRWILKQQGIDLSQPVAGAMNAKCRSVSENDERILIEQVLGDQVRFLPVVDNSFRVTAVVSRQRSVVTIDGFTISPTSSTYIIAEIGNNHNGDLKVAKQLVDEAKRAGANCVKFQMRDLSTLYANKGSPNDVREDLGSQYVLDLLSRFQLSDQAFKALFDYCRTQGITALCTPFDIVSANKLVALGVKAFKVASADLTNHPLLIHLAHKRLPMLVSTGMSTEEEVKLAVNILRDEGAQFVLLHCNSTYPAPFKDIQLNYMQKLARMNDGLVGYSGHERGQSIAIAAVALGAKVIERHFTLDRDQEGNDHKVSLLPDEFASMVTAIRQVEQALQSNDTRVLSQGELMNREVLGKSIVAVKPIKKGEVIISEYLDIKSPGKGLQPYFLEKLVGTRAKRDLNAGEFFFKSDLPEHKHVIPRHYKLPGAFGIPVRYHDLELSTQSNCDVVEFHLSYKDLQVKPEHFLSLNERQRVLVHAPELFENDHILDLGSDHDVYWQNSIANLERVFDVARKIKPYYPSTDKVSVVVNAGGFSNDGFISVEERRRKYKRVASALKLMNTTDIDVLVQSMPPFPWHFGGQQFHNLFVDPSEIAQFCEEFDVNVCLDLSHSWLACHHYGYDLSDFFKRINTRIKHIHVADAKGIDEEGLQIGQGTLPVAFVFECYLTYCPDASWIPEIWQGHKNSGEGFWLAFERIEQYLKEAE